VTASGPLKHHVVTWCARTCGCGIAFYRTPISLAGKEIDLLLEDYQADAAGSQVVGEREEVLERPPGVCRFVRGIPVGIGRSVADLWGSCGARKSS
jgi:hypothetical protein